MPGPDYPELGDLASISAVIGADRRQVQGPGGNTSIKTGETLWIKASGKWLARALHESVFVPVDLIKVRTAFAAGAPDPVTGAALSEAGGLVPSIETSFHAMIERRVVIHTHSVAAIALAVRDDAAEVLPSLLDGIDWVLAPYARPGTPLTKAMMEAMSGRNQDVIILANHGLVVCAEDCRSAAALLAEVERRLAGNARPAGECDLAALLPIASGSRYEPAGDMSLHSLACDPVSLRIAVAGSLYPDHVVFLGSGAKQVEPETPLEEIREILSCAPPFVAVRHAGVLLRRDLPPAARAMVACLADVAALIPETAPLRYLTAEEEAELTGFDAERVRQVLNG